MPEASYSVILYPELKDCGSGIRVLDLALLYYVQPVRFDFKHPQTVSKLAGAWSVVSVL